MVLGRVQLLEANQKLALAVMEQAGLGFSMRGFGACRFLVAPEIKEQL
jgi:predicted deacetylase